MLYEVSELETTARKLMTEVFERGWKDWGLAERVLAKAFMADHASERSREDWVRLGEVLENVEFKHSAQPQIKRAFNRMVRAGYLYSKVKGDTRNYGIHFNKD